MFIPMPEPTFDEYLGVDEAARFLGVAPSTLRHWTNTGKVRCHRHPLNKYRKFDPRDLEELLRQLRESRDEPPEPKPKKNH